MTLRTNKLYSIFAAAGLAAVSLAGCGDDDGGGGGGDAGSGDAGETSTPTGGKAGNTGGKAGSTGGAEPGTGGGTAEGGETAQGGEATGTGGEAPAEGGATGQGGATAEGGAPTETGGDAGATGTTGGSGTGGTPPTSADVDDVIIAVCNWEFQCCDAGERNYQLSPFITDAEDCAATLIGQMRNSNVADSPYPATSPATDGALVGQLGYQVNLDRVAVNETGSAECVAWWLARGCNEEAGDVQHCEGAGAAANPCALTNLFDPILNIGDPCTLELTESGAENDVECVEGSTCLPAAHADNPEEVDACVQRGTDGDSCTNDTHCDFNFYCNSAGDCTPKGDVGEPCTFDDPVDPDPLVIEDPCRVGLTCHPLDFECVDSCTEGYGCSVNTGYVANDDPTDVDDPADYSCPEGMGCAPLEVNEAEGVFRVCTPLGGDATATCNSHEDCEADFYCDGASGNCTAKGNSITDACTSQYQCDVGFHCDGANCANNLPATTACTTNEQCGPNSAGCLDEGGGMTFCRNALLANGADCGVDAACASGRCEWDTGDAANTCVPGADAGDSCDGQVGEAASQRCAPGLYCYGETADPSSGECVTQAGPGQDCNDPGDMPAMAMCANASPCTDVWEEGEICDDRPVPETNGGTGVQCDGSE